MQVAERRVRLVEHDPARRVERPVAGGREVVGELLDPWLVRHRGMRVRRARRRLGRVLSARAVDVVVLLGERVVRLELVVGDRPGRARCRRGAAARRSPPCEAGTAPRRTSSSRLRRSSALPAGRACRPRRTTCPARRSGCPRTPSSVRPVLGLARKPVAALEQEDALPGGREVAGERSAARAGPDDDHVVGVHHEISSSRSARMMRAAASISARWENACGKFPRWRPVLTSNSSAIEPERRRDAQEPLHEIARALLLPDDRERGHEPERADEERPLLAGEAVVGLLGPVAEDEAVLASARPRPRAPSCAGVRRHAGRKPKIAARSVEASSESVA